MTVKMILQGGPLDGEQQIVENLNTTPGYQMQFVMPNHQIFGTAGSGVQALGLTVIYAYSGPGPGPGAGDTWTTSSIYQYVIGTSSAPPPAAITPGPPPQQGPAVWMGVSGNLTVNANDPSPGVHEVGESAMWVDGTQTSVGYATIGLTAETTLSVTRQTWQNYITMAGSTSMSVTPN